MASRNQASSVAGSVSPLDEPAAGKRPHLGATQALKQRHTPLQMRAARGFGTQQDQLGGVRWMPGGVCQRDHAPKRRAQNDGVYNPQRLAERVNIVTPLR